MQVTHGTVQPRGEPLALTIGNFDGVHLGHRAMLERLTGQAKALGLRSCVLTFEPHPREFFARDAAPTRLTRLRDKLELLAGTGVQRVHLLKFDARLAALPAEQFVKDVLVRGLQTRWLLVGQDFRFGQRRTGDYALLAASGPRWGFHAEAMPDVLDGIERVSSSAVRAALAAGDLGRAARFLGRPYAISGRVAHGEKLGRTLGFPTANVVLRRRPALAGIFAVEATLEETRQNLRGVASVGRRPTVKDNAAPLLEVHLFDWAGTLYGRHLRVRFLHKLRDEEKYAGLDALRAAIGRDAQQAKDYFKGNGLKKNV